MKRVAFFLSALLLNVSPSHATPFTTSGTVYTLQTHDLVSSGSDADWFSLVGVTSLGTCPTGDGGNVVLALRDDQNGQRMFSLVLAARSAGTTLTVRVDDTLKNSTGYCYARAVF
jgi:hypothetical protein